MGEAEFKFLPSEVLHVGVSGNRTFDAEGKWRLIAACRQPGVSVPGVTLKAGVNANQLCKFRASKRREVGPPPLVVAKD